MNYTTIQGDTFESVAWKELGDSTRMDEILRLNRQYMETAVFSAGVTLTLPEEETQTATEAVSGTPPWRR